MKVYRIKVALFYKKRTYRNIEILANQSLADLHASIFEAFDRYDGHLYSFFLTQKKIKNTSYIYDYPEITHPMNLEDLGGFANKKKYNAEMMKIKDLELAEKSKFYYLFDFGDEWWHELSVLNIEDASGSKGYPKITKKAGDSLEQYPDDEDGYEDDDFY
jgi:Plasmid pRiA4b ORF-3-like protein